MDTMRCVSKPEKGGKEYYKKNWGVLQSFQGEYTTYKFRGI